MKHILILGDGMADRPLSELGGKTPLEAARTPNMDFIAKNGKCGLLKTLSGDMPLGSDIANMSILGYDPKKYYTGGRGPIEAASMGIKLGKDETAFRCNLVTVENGIMKDYSGGQVSKKESMEIIDFLNNRLAREGIQFYSGVGYRNIMVAKGDFNVECAPPHDIIGEKISLNMAKGKDPALLNELMLKSQQLLSGHEVNKKRIKKGIQPANMIWLWGGGKRPQLPPFKEKFHMDGAMISAVDLLKGIAKSAGMDVIEVPGATAYLDTNYKGKADYAVNALEDHDFVYLHIEAPDEASHEGNLAEKIKAIEKVDWVAGRVMKKMDGDFSIAVLPDHATPIEVKTHTSEPVPFAIYSTRKEGDRVQEFSEKAAKGGIYGLRQGIEFMDLFLSK
ncbi:MAG: cofactor-independent phosphoglycerate mutase [Candidatus Altiarchaeales archaeon IMC4]|nr:MAG: cofactor-independent phosphoglycerate mutase [Candidatus Altiarchaeales archaeon IMC4]